MKLDGRSMETHLLCPPAALTGTSASCIWKAGFHHPIIAETVSLLDDIVDCAKIKFKTRGGDGAYSNDKMTNWESSKTWQRSVPCQIGCINHSNALIEVSQVHCVGHDLQKNLMTLMSLLRMTGSFARIISSVHRSLDSASMPLHLHFCEPPPEARSFTLALQNYMVANHRTFRKAARTHVEPSSVKAPRDTAKEIYLKAWNNFVFWFNGCWQFQHGSLFSTSWLRVFWFSTSTLWYFYIHIYVFNYIYIYIYVATSLKPKLRIIHDLTYVRHQYVVSFPKYHFNNHTWFMIFELHIHHKLYIHESDLKSFKKCINPSGATTHTICFFILSKRFKYINTQIDFRKKKYVAGLPNISN